MPTCILVTGRTLDLTRSTLIPTWAKHNNRWDSDDMVNIYRSDIKEEIAKAAGLNFIDMRQVILSTAPSQSGSHWLLLDVVSLSTQLYLD